MSLEAQNIYRKVNPIRGWADILLGPITSSIFTENSLTFLITEGTDPCDPTTTLPSQQLMVMITARCCECQEGNKPGFVAQEFARRKKVFRELNSYAHNFNSTDDLFYASGCFDVSLETCLVRDPLTGCPADQVQFDVTLTLEELSILFIDIWSESLIVEGSPFDFWPLRPDSAFPNCTPSLECGDIPGVWVWQFVPYLLMAPLDLPYYSVGEGISITEAYGDFASYLGTTTYDPPFSFLMNQNTVKVFDSDNIEIGYFAYDYCEEEDECPPGFTLVNGVCQFDPPTIPPEGCFDEEGAPLDCGEELCPYELQFLYQSDMSQYSSSTSRGTITKFDCDPVPLSPTSTFTPASFSGIAMPNATNWVSLYRSSALRNNRDTWILPYPGIDCVDYEGPSWDLATQGSTTLDVISCAGFTGAGAICGYSIGSISGPATTYNLTTSRQGTVSGCEKITKTPLVNRGGGKGGVRTPLLASDCSGNSAVVSVFNTQTYTVERHFVRPRDCNGYLGDPINIGGNDPDPPDPFDPGDPPMCWYSIAVRLNVRVRIPLNNGVYVAFAFGIPIFRKVVKSEVEISNVVLNIVEVVGEAALDITISWLTGSLVKRVAFRWLDDYVSLGPDIDITLLRCDS